MSVSMHSYCQNQNLPNSRGGEIPPSMQPWNSKQICSKISITNYRSTKGSTKCPHLQDTFYIPIPSPPVA